MRKFLILWPMILATTAFALTPLELQSVVNEAQHSVNELPKPDEEEVVIAVAVSLSMPKASLQRLARDATDAGLALSFRGVGVEMNDKPDEKPQTVLERYGRGLIARHMKDFKFLTDKGASVKIDPVLFNRHGIKDVPQVLLLPVCRHACENTQALFAARGDVTLRYALVYLSQKIDSALNKDKTSQLLKAKSLVDDALNRLGERP